MRFPSDKELTEYTLFLSLLSGSSKVLTISIFMLKVDFVVTISVLLVMGGLSSLPGQVKSNVSLLPLFFTLVAVQVASGSTVLGVNASIGMQCSSVTLLVSGFKLELVVLFTEYCPGTKGIELSAARDADTDIRITNETISDNLNNCLYLHFLGNLFMRTNYK
jgi:hypothetical protein